MPTSQLVETHLPSVVGLVAVLLAGHATVSVAQAALGPERQDIRNFGGDIWSVWAAPRRLGNGNMIPTAIAVSLVAITSQFDSATYAWMTQHEQSPVMRALSPLREHASIPAYELGSGQVLLPISGALYATGRLSRSIGLRDAGLGCGEAHLASLGIREVVTHVVARARPRVTPKPFHFSMPGSRDWLWQSFFSGHIANSMACASFLNHRYQLGIVGALPYAYSAAIGVGRLADGAHWTSDAALGAIVGFAIGKEIAGRQLARNTSAAHASGTFSTGRTVWNIPLLQWPSPF